MVEQLRQVRQAIARAAANLTDLEAKCGATLEAAGLSFGQMVKLTVDYDPLDTVISRKERRLEEIAAFLLSPDDITAIDGNDETALEAMEASFVCKKATLEVQKAEIVERLGKPARDYQQFLKDLKLWTDREKELHGDDQNPAAETLKGLERELVNVRTKYPDRLRMARDERLHIAQDVFNKKRGLTQFYNSVKRSIDAEIAKCREDLGEYDIAIEAGLRFHHFA